MASRTWTWKSTTLSEKVATNSPDYSVSNDGDNRQTRMLWTPGNTIKQAFIDILGYSSVSIDGSGNKYVSRQIPMPDTRFAGVFYANRISHVGSTPGDGATTSGMGGAGQGYDADNVSLYDKVLLTVEYDSPRFAILTDQEMLDNSYTDSNGNPDESKLVRYVEPDFQPVGKYQTLPAMAAIAWDSDQKPMTANAVVLLHEGDVEVIWKRVPLAAFPITAIKNTVGKTNTAAFGIAGSVIGILPAGSLVCCFPRIKWYRQITGSFVMDICYKFRFYPNGANSFYRYDVATPGFYAASRKGLGTDASKIFKPTSYADLFKPEP